MTTWLALLLAVAGVGVGRWCAQKSRRDGKAFQDLLRGLTFGTQMAVAIEKKIKICIAILFAALLVNGLVSYRATRTLTDNEQWVAQVLAHMFQSRSPSKNSLLPSARRREPLKTQSPAEEGSSDSQIS
jgi:hypothetical protein